MGRNSVLEPSLDPVIAQRIKYGIHAHFGGDNKRAIRHFKGAANELGGVEKLPPRGLAYYALSLVMTGQRRSDAISFGRAALERDCVDTDLYVVLANVYLRTGRRALALETVNNGLRVSADDKALCRLKERLDRRKAPSRALRFLASDNPLNLALGRLRRSS